MANKTLSDFPVLSNLDAASIAHVQKELVDYQVPLDTLTQYVTENAEYAAMGDKINGASEKTTPVDADMIGLMDSAASNILKKLSWSHIKAALADGWTSANEEWTYSSADAPVYVVTVPTGAASRYTLGWRVKLTDVTVKYFIIVAISDTTLTLYGGTDYTLSGGAITLNYVSPMKIPKGFNASPEKWTVSITNTSRINISSVVSGTWYNIISISIPIGSWDCQYSALGACIRAAATGMTFYFTLSTANNSQSNNAYSTFCYAPGYQVSGSTLARFKLLLASKTTYYLNMSSQATVIDSMAVYGDVIPTNINLVCAYL